MYKRSEPIILLHSVKNHMANVYSSEVCLQTKKFPKISKFFFFKNTPKYDKLSKISNISIKTMLELRTKFGNFGNFGNFGHISDGLRKQSSVRTQCCNLIGSEPLYIPCSVYVIQSKCSHGAIVTMTLNPTQLIKIKVKVTSLPNRFTKNLTDVRSFTSSNDKDQRKQIAFAFAQGKTPLVARNESQPLSHRVNSP